MKRKMICAAIAKTAIDDKAYKDWLKTYTNGTDKKGLITYKLTEFNISNSCAN